MIWKKKHAWEEKDRVSKEQGVELGPGGGGGRDDRQGGWEGPCVL